MIKNIKFLFNPIFIRNFNQVNNPATNCFTRLHLNLLSWDNLNAFKHHFSVLCLQLTSFYITKILKICTSNTQSAKSQNTLYIQSTFCINYGLFSDSALAIIVIDFSEPSHISDHNLISYWFYIDLFLPDVPK